MTASFRHFRPVVFLFCLLLGLAAALPSAAAATADPAPAGLRIENRAEASYFHEGLGIRETVLSNRVEAVVQEVPVVDVLGGTRHRLSRGAREEHHFTIRNAGNTVLNVVLGVSDARDAATFRRAKMVLDRDADGSIGPGDPGLSAGTSMTLAIGEAVRLIYAFEVAPGASAGDRVISTLDVGAASAQTGARASGNTRAEGEVIVVDQALELDKSLARRSVAAGEELAFTLRLRNDSERDLPGYSVIDGQPLQIDGAAATGILVRDPVPLNTVFVAHGATGGFTPLYHLGGAALHSYQTGAPADPGLVDAVAFYLAGDYPVGRSSDLVFRVLAPARLGSVDVTNTAETYLPDAAGPDAVPSNPVDLQIVSQIPVALGFQDPATGLAQDFASLGGDTSLQFMAGACNTGRDIDTVEIAVSSVLTGDAELLVARETGTNTGVFVTAPLPLARMTTPVHFDGVMASDSGDRLVARAACDGQSDTAELAVDPGNFVFDSVTGAPVEGAPVQVIGAGGDVVATAETDARGYFGIGALPAGGYRYRVGPVAGFAFPSVKRAFPGYGRRVIDPVSWGGAVTHAGGAFHPADLPVDPAYPIALTLEKTADRAEAPTGGLVRYTLIAKNRMNQALIGAEIFDQTPPGTQIMPGTVALDGRTVADPADDGQGGLAFALGTLAPGQTVELSYLMRITPLAPEGEIMNVATLSGQQAGTGQTRRSAPARATVRHDNTGSVLSREGTIIGAVFLDCNGNGIRDGADEPGVPGVKIVTQQGLSVVTDLDGKYSIFGLRPKAHVLAVQSRTLPEGAEVRITRTADLRSAGTRLVALKRGEMRAEHFALAPCTGPVMDAVAARVAAFADRAASASALNADLPIEAGRPDRRAVRSEAGIATTTQILRRGPEAPAPARTPAAPAPTAPPKLEDIIKTLTPEAGFLGIEDGAQIPRAVLSVRVKGKADLSLALSLNGEAVTPDRIGERSVWAGGNLQAIEYVALPLRPGKNALVLTGADPFGIVRETRSITVEAPGAPARFGIVLPETAPAAPGTVVPVVVRILDAAGRPVEASAVVTLRARNATWDVTDIRRDQAGIQAFVDNGEATFGLIAPQIAGTDTVSVEGTHGRAEARIGFTPDLEERILVGVIEGAVRLGGGGDLIEPDRISSFEDTTTGIQGELYLKGRIRGDALLTLRYSSDRDTEDRLFRDIRPDEYYPVYGDNSERGFDAQSSGNLYVKIEKGQSYVLYGDIAIEPESSAFQLGGMSRVVRGAKAHWAGENVRVTVFAARTAQVQRVVEFRGRGVSGPYDLDLESFREGSDRVEILVRDADSGEILSAEPLRRFEDYILDFFAGSIIFDAPVAQADADGNPVSVRVTIETEDEAAERHWLYGGELHVQVNERTEAGLRVVHNDADPASGARERVQAAYVRTHPDQHTTVEAELAHGESVDGSAGLAARLSYLRDDGKTRLSLEASHAERGFAPSGSSVRPGTDRVALGFGRTVSPDLSYNLLALYLADHVAGTETVEAEAKAKKRLSDLAWGHFGVRAERDLKAGETRAFVMAGAEWRGAEGSPVRFRLGYEAPFLGHARGTLDLGFDYAVTPDLTVTGDLQLATGPDMRFRYAESMKIGVDYRFNDWLTARSTLDGTGGGDGRMEARLTQGLEGRWQAIETLAVRAALEHAQSLESGEDRLTSLALGAEFRSRDGRWVADADLDQSWDSDGRTLYADLGLAGQIGDGLTVLGRSRYTRDESDGGPVDIRHRTRLGLAWRPTTDPRLETLAWYERRMNRGRATSAETLWSAQASFEVSADLRMNAKYAGHRVEAATAAGGSAVAVTQLAQAGVEIDLGDDRFALGLNAMHLWDDAGNSRSAAGAELGYAVAKGTMVSLGYNWSHGDRVNGRALYRDGVYVMVRMTLDDSLWDRLAGFLTE